DTCPVSLYALAERIVRELPWPRTDRMTSINRLQLRATSTESNWVNPVGPGLSIAHRRPEADTVENAPCTAWMSSRPRSSPDRPTEDRGSERHPKSIAHSRFPGPGV